MMKTRRTPFDQYLGHDMDTEGDEAEEMLSATLPLVGTVVWFFNSLEKGLDSAICEAINDRSDAIGLNVIHGMAYGQKVDLYRRLCEDLHGCFSAPEVPSFDGLSAALKEAAVLRNLVVHADWSHSDAEGYTYTRLHIKRGGMMQEYTQLTPDSMEQVIRRIQHASELFDAYFFERTELMRDKRHDKPTPAPESP